MALRAFKLVGGSHRDEKGRVYDKKENNIVKSRDDLRVTFPNKFELIENVALTDDDEDEDEEEPEEVDTDIDTDDEDEQEAPKPKRSKKPKKTKKEKTSKKKRSRTRSRFDD